jgi:hypothetical protein
VLRTFTLDTNCLIDVEENRPAASKIRALADTHTAGRADIAVIAMSASENPKPGQHRIQDFSEFKARLAALSLAHLNIILPMMYWDISFWGHGLWCDAAMVDLERQIHSVLFPKEQFLWQDYCRDKGINPPPNIPCGRWRNHKCDVQAIWSHIHSGRDVFVTTDRGFHTRKLALINLGAGQIEYPDSAVTLL